MDGCVRRGEPVTEGCHSENVCVFADGQIDRSPIGTGVSGRLAIQYNRGNLEVSEEYVVESIVGTVFRGKVTERESMVNTTPLFPKPVGVPTSPAEPNLR